MDSGGYIFGVDPADGVWDGLLGWTIAVNPGEDHWDSSWRDSGDRSLG